MDKRPSDDRPTAAPAATSAQHASVTLTSLEGNATLVRREAGDLYVLPHVQGEHPIEGRALIWLLSPAADGRPSRLLRLADGGTVNAGVNGAEVVTPRCTVEEHEAFPHTDVLGNAFSLNISHGEELEEALAAFYWDTILPCVVERTAGAAYPDREGFVQSSPSTERFAGTYPACDHEFGIKGRLAFGNELDLAVTRRMIELSLRMMRENPDGYWGCPCAVQPNGDREYLWTRGTLDGAAEAQMFRVSGNAEVLESAWLYYALSRDRVWLADHIDDLEGATRQIERFLNDDGWLDGAAFYEDAVIKDGCSAETTALTAHALNLLADLESVLGRADRAERFRLMSQRMANRLARPFPDGFWDAENHRFIDWIDRRGVPHDHLHLLANILPPLTGWATAEQRADVAALMSQEFAEFQRFPSFVAARIADYTESEIGIHGPFDSCAMGRTWCWDAAYWHSRGEGRVLLDQLLKVARRGRAGGWRMAERYDMEHVYFIDGVDYHGSTYYYEYPCVFAWVLIHEYLGVRPSIEADLEIAPRLAGDGEVRLTSPRYAVAYRVDGDRLSITNLAPDTRTFRVEGVAAPLSLGPGETRSVGLHPNARDLGDGVPLPSGEEDPDAER